MVEEKPVVHARVANITGVPSAPTLERRPTLPLRANKRPPKHPPLKRIRIMKERGNLTKSGYIYKAMTNLGEKASQLNYNVAQRGPRGEELIQKVTNKQTTPEGEISGTISELVYPTVPSNIRESKEAPVRVPKVYIKWGEQQIGEDTYAKGRSPGYFTPPRARPKPLPPVTAPVKPVVTPKPPVPPIPAVKIPVMPPVAIPKPPVKIPPKEWYFDDDTLRCKELLQDAPISESARRFANRGKCQSALVKHIRGTRKITFKRPAEIARPQKRKLPARAEELMKKRAFPKAVKEAIEKGLERKEAPPDIERIIEKVAKMNEPDYIVEKTIAKRLANGVVQYKVKTNKGYIIYENADEITKNATLGMKTPTGEIIPLQIKVIR
jgi:hypothetical protein